MACETSKAAPRRVKMEIFHRAFAGFGLDIGAGPDPLHPSMGFPFMEVCEPFDVGQGDANLIDELRPLESYDFVHASQCLEHMHDPWDCVWRWLRLVKPGGYLIFSVPDWELYEGCHWPSFHNPDHKTAWGLGPQRTPNRRENMAGPRYINLLDFVQRLPALPMLIQVADAGYDYGQPSKTLDQTLSCNAEAFLEVILWKRP